MMIKDEHGTSRTVAGRGTTALGTIGTILGGVAVANQMNTGCGCGNNGILGGLFGNNNNDCYVTKYELAQNEAIGALESKIAYLEGRGYTDQVGLEIYTALVKADKEQTEKANATTISLIDTIARLDKETAVNRAVTNKNLELLNQKVDFSFLLTNQNIESNYVKAAKKISLCDICPTPAVAEAVQPVPVCSSCNN